MYGSQSDVCWLHAGLLTVLECAQPSAMVHFYPQEMAGGVHDAAAEADFVTKLSASGLMVLHENC